MISTDNLFAAMTTFLVVNFLALGLRIHVRAFINKGFGYDDIMLCLGYVSSCATILFSFFFFFLLPTERNWPADP